MHVISVLSSLSVLFMPSQFDTSVQRLSLLPFALAQKGSSISLVIITSQTFGNDTHCEPYRKQAL